MGFVFIVSSCSYTHTYQLKNQKADLVFEKVSRYFIDDHKKIKNRFRPLDFEYGSAHKKKLELTLFFQDANKRPLSDLNVVHNELLKQKKGRSKRVRAYFIQEGEDVLIKIIVDQFFPSSNVHRQLNAYIETLFLDLKIK